MQQSDVKLRKALTRALESSCPLAVNGDPSELVTFWTAELGLAWTLVNARYQAVPNYHAAVVDLLLSTQRDFLDVALTFANIKDEDLPDVDREWVESPEEQLPPTPPKPIVGPEELKRVEDNPYLLGVDFVAREDAQDALTAWLQDESLERKRVFCIYNLGGTGKTALVWDWLQSRNTEALLNQFKYNSYWTTFYARNYDWKACLRRLADLVGLGSIFGPLSSKMEIEGAFFVLQNAIVESLKSQKWLLIFDGLEREMGAFADPRYLELDSEQQDIKIESRPENYIAAERQIRSLIFRSFITGLLDTQAKVIITSRLVREDLICGGKPHNRVLEYPLESLDKGIGESKEVAVRWANSVWASAGGKSGAEAFLQEFFDLVDFHPQVITIVSASVAAATKDNFAHFDEWFFHNSAFSEEERNACREKGAYKTVLRHRWLDLAMRDIQEHKRKGWILLCCIASNPRATDIGQLEKHFVHSGGESLFISKMELIDSLNMLKTRRLLGIDATYTNVDVHPVVRCQVTKYIRKQGELSGEHVDHELIRYLPDDAFVKLITQANLEESLNVLKSGSLSGIGYSMSTQVLTRFFPDAEDPLTPWRDVLPALSLRKDQAWCLLETARVLMAQGLWEETDVLFSRAEVLYRLISDQESIEMCRRGHDWQRLYGAGLYLCEQHILDQIEQKANRDRDHYWLAISMAIRRHDSAEALLKELCEDIDRWTMQTIAEAWYYLENYEKAAQLVTSALKRDEVVRPEQELWEKVTLGLALLRMENLDGAIYYLDSAMDEGMRISYRLVPMFARAGYIEFLYRKGEKLPATSPVLRRQLFSEALRMYSEHKRSDPNNLYQIPTTEAHLAGAMAHFALGDFEVAKEAALEALATARGNQYPFVYYSGQRRALEFLEKAFHVSKKDLPEAKRNVTRVDEDIHEKRIHEWMMCREKNR